MENQAKQLFASIQEANEILIVIHRKPDGDALGSGLALYNFLISINKKATFFCIDKPAENFHSLKNINKLTDDKKLLDEKYDLCVVLDCGDLYMSKIENEIRNKKFKLGLVNIDHHKTNPNYGDLNIVITKSSSTAEIIFLLLTSWNIKFNSDIATCLLTGIITDTSNFTNGATTKNSIEISSKLLSAGANISEVLKAHVYNKTINTLKLWGLALKRITFSKKLSMVSTVIFNKDLENFELDDEAVEGISNYLNNLSSEVNFSLLLKDNNIGKVKGSLRTTKNDIDVSKIAQNFGGGGHKKAAGFEVDGFVKLQDEQWQIIN